MGKCKIKFIIIVNSAGVPLITLKLEEEINEVMISGVLSAIYNLGASSFQNQLSKITIEGTNARIDSVVFKYEGDDPLIIFALLSQEISHGEFMRFVNDIATQFYEKYHNVLPTWRGDLDEFAPFKEILKEKIVKWFPPQAENFELKMDAVFEKVLSGDFSGLDDILEEK